MKTLRKILFLINVLSLLISCTAGMPPAYAPTKPPTSEKNLFESSRLVGCYQHEIGKELNSPKMFLWPTTKIDQDTGVPVAMSLNEQSDVRQKIVSLADLVDELSALKRGEQDKIAKAFDLDLSDLETQFTQNKCYSFCDPNDFLCDPNDKTILQVEVWKETEDPSEKLLITQCQENQTNRDDLNFKKKEQIAKNVEPLRKKEGEASLKLLQEIGDRNFFPALTKFEFRYDEKNESSFFYLEIIYGDKKFSSREGSQTLIREVNLDLVNGFLTFKMDAIDVDNDNRIFGEFFFDLELNPKENLFKVEGDIRLNYLSGKKERIGRFSSSGQIVLLPEDGSVCKK